MKILLNEDLPAGAFLIRDSETRYGQYDGGNRVQPDVSKFFKFLCFLTKSVIGQPIAN